MSAHTARPPRRFNGQREGLARLAIWPACQLTDDVREQIGQKPAHGPDRDLYHRFPGLRLIRLITTGTTKNVASGPDTAVTCRDDDRRSSISGSLLGLREDRLPNDRLGDEKVRELLVMKARVHR